MATESVVMKEFAVGSATVRVHCGLSEDPARAYGIEIVGDLPSNFRGLPRGTMIRIVRTLSLMARQCAASAQKEVGEWAGMLLASDRPAPRRAKDTQPAKPAAGTPQGKSKDAGSAASAK